MGESRATVMNQTTDMKHVLVEKRQHGSLISLHVEAPRGVDGAKGGWCAKPRPQHITGKKSALRDLSQF